MLIRYCAIIFGCLALGEGIVYLTHVPFPPSVIGMLFLTLFLHLGWIKLHWVKAMSDILVANLGLFFVPPSVAIMLYFDLIAANFWSIMIAVIVSTIAVVIATGHVYQFLRKKIKKS
ncbi:MAG: CidA/LrgA family protein [Capnocytophaga sp.]|nr:CidA/LrgA family protein [Capnocytophaga sp.]